VPFLCLLTGKFSAARTVTTIPHDPNHYHHLYYYYYYHHHHHHYHYPSIRGRHGIVSWAGRCDSRHQGWCFWLVFLFFPNSRDFLPYSVTLVPNTTWHTYTHTQHKVPTHRKIFWYTASPSLFPHPRFWTRVLLPLPSPCTVVWKPLRVFLTPGRGLSSGWGDMFLSFSFLPLESSHCAYSCVSGSYKRGMQKTSLHPRSEIVPTHMWGSTQRDTGLVGMRGVISPPCSTLRTREGDVSGQYVDYSKSFCFQYVLGVGILHIHCFHSLYLNMYHLHDFRRKSLLGCNKM
jgi:hypothetical protein